METYQKVNVRHPSWSISETLWQMSCAKQGGDEHYDPASEHKIINRDKVRQELWNKQLQNPALALTEAVRRVEEWEEAGSSTAGGRSGCQNGAPRTRVF